VKKSKAVLGIGAEGGGCPLNVFFPPPKVAGARSTSFLPQLKATGARSTSFFRVPGIGIQNTL